MKSFLSWVGGKSRLAAAITAQFPKHQTYVEVFGGAGWVLFDKDPKVSKVEVYNDLDGDLVNLFRVVKHRPAELVECLNLSLYSRGMYYRLMKGGSDEGEVVKAARFFYLIKSSFGGRYGAGWGYGRTRPPAVLNNLEFLKKVSKRLEKVYVDNRTFDRVISAFDTDKTLFYLDPPYRMGKEKFYVHDFDESNHLRLREVLGAVKGQFILSYNDCPEIRKLYKGFRVRKTKSIHYSANNKRSTARHKSEILIRNF